MGGITVGAVLLSALASAVWVADDTRLYGRVTTTDGAVVEGYLRWDRNEAGPWDFLDGAKEIAPEVMREAERLDPELAAEMRRQRSIVAFGVRIRWEVDDLAGPPQEPAAIRFGHIASLEPVDGRRVRLTLKDGTLVEMLGRSTDIGGAMRGLSVEPPGGDPVQLRWRELARIDFLEAPAGAAPPASHRIHGTVLTWSGHELTGYVAWDRDEVLGSDELDGRENGVDHRIRFDSIESIEPLDRRSARVVLRSGVERILRGTNDVEGSIRGIEVSIPGLGRATLDWEELREARFHTRREGEAERHAGRGAPDDESRPGPLAEPAGVAGSAGDEATGERLRGTVYARDGRVLEGEIRWGLDEEHRWEILDGWSGDTDFDVELGAIRSIAPDGDAAAILTLADGSTLSLEGTDDVGEGHLGVYVKPEGRARRLVRWRDVDRVVLGR